MPILGSLIKKAYELRSKPLDKRRKIDCYKAQKNELQKLLRKSQFTAFGEYFNFSKILKSGDFVKLFQENVPVHDYNSMYKKWWYRSLNGESFVCWPGRVKYFALSSGTSEASSKQIPVTSDMLKSIRKASFRQLVSTSKYDFPLEFYRKVILMIGGSTHLQYNGMYYEGDLSGITTGNIPFWFQHFYKPGRRISKAPDWETKLQDIVKKAPEWDIGIIVGVPAWIQILLERIIKKYNLKTIHDIWPNLSAYVHSGVSFSPYIKSFEKLFSRPIFYTESYLASEGYIAFQNRIGVKSMEMLLNNGIFFEFVPFNNLNFDEDGNLKKNPKTLTIKEVEEDKEYALLLSNNAGAWRYLIGDTIKFTSKQKSEIIITGRTKHFISICGEHLSVENINRAIELFQEEFNVEIREFTVCGIEYNSMFAHKWYLGTDDKIDPEIAKQKIDEYLSNLNDDYRVERMEAIKDVFVEVVPTEVFRKWLKKKGKEGGANKFPRVFKKEQVAEWEEHIKECLNLNN